MRTIWKFTLYLHGAWEVVMPVGAEIVHVEGVDEEINLWAIVDPEAEKVSRHFWIVGTGHPINTASPYIGTAVVAPYVWHVFG